MRGLQANSREWRPKENNILAVYKEHAEVNGGATIDWLNSQLYQVAQSNEIAVFLSSQYGSNGNFTSNLYDYGLLHSADWAEGQQAGRSGRYYINESDYMFGHALEYQLPASWTDLRDIDPAEFLPLFMVHDADLNLTGRLVATALESGAAGMPTLERLSNTDEDFMNALFGHLPEDYRTQTMDEVIELGPEGRVYRLMTLMDARGAAPIGEAFSRAARQVPAEPFLMDWLYDEKVFNSISLEQNYALKMALRQSILKSENTAAVAVVREQFGNWMDAALPGYVEESFTAQDRLNVIYNSDKVVFLESYINEIGMPGITAGLVKIPGLTGLSYSNTITNSVSLGLLSPAILQYVNTPSPQNIDTDTLWLAEHHLYGSSRLGIKQYDSHQYRNVYSNTQPFEKGINVRQPWYSMGSEELIKSGIKAVPLLSSHYLADTFRYVRDIGTKYYELSDHLGNVLATVLDRKTGYGAANGEYAGFKADIASATDYYPYGQLMDGRAFSSADYRMGYSGKEHDNEVRGLGNSIDFGERIYDTRIVTWLSRDPMASKYPGVNPYAYVRNNPIWRYDPDGRTDYAANVEVNKNSKGQITKTITVNITYAVLNISNKELYSANAVSGAQYNMSSFSGNTSYKEGGKTINVNIQTNISYRLVEKLDQVKQGENLLLVVDDVEKMSGDKHAVSNPIARAMFEGNVMAVEHAYKNDLNTIWHEMGHNLGFYFGGNKKDPLHSPNPNELMYFRVTNTTRVNSADLPNGFADVIRKPAGRYNIQGNRGGNIIRNAKNFIDGNYKYNRERAKKAGL